MLLALYAVWKTHPLCPKPVKTEIWPVPSWERKVAINENAAHADTWLVACFSRKQMCVLVFLWAQGEQDTGDESLVALLEDWN